MKKRLLKVLPLLIAGGLALTGCGSVDVGIHVNNKDSADVKVSVEGSKAELDKRISATGQNTSANYTAGLLLEGTLLQSRQANSALPAYTFTESNKGDVQKAEARMDNVALGDLPSLAMNSAVAYDSDHYTFTGTRPEDTTLGKTTEKGSEVIPVTVKVTFPQAVSQASAGGEIEGNTVTWDLSEMKANQTFTAVTYGPGLAWWASALIFLAGVVAMGLLVAIALMSGRKDERRDPGEPTATA